jgi:hypothetical protein
VLSERSTTIFCSDPKDVMLQEEGRACDKAMIQARSNGGIFPRYIDLMAKVIQGMGYSGEAGHAILEFFKSKMVGGGSSPRD